jgi:cell division protein FtsI (penicillin-binding protein 3)
VFAAFGIAFVLITYKLVAIQGLGNARLAEVTNAYQSDQPLPNLRGSILAAGGDELALSELRPTIYANPPEIADAAPAAKRSVAGERAWEAAQLAPLIGTSVQAIEADFAEKTTYAVLATDQPEAVAVAVEKLALPGINYTEQAVRFHPDGTLASPLLGAVNSLGGYSGLESEYNGVLAGAPGKLVQSVDLAGEPIPGSVTEDKPAVNGDDILTTINESLQYQTEQALSQAITSSRSKAGGTAIVMNTRTGALLAVASMVPSSKGPVEAPTAQAFTNVYEPGSVAKVVTVSAALAHHKITPSTKITIPDSYPVAGTDFHDAEFHPTEQLTPTGILAQSSNIGAIQIAQKLGPQELYSYERAYGLTTRTAVDFPGESSGLVTPLAKFSGTTLPTLAFGEANAVTAAQMIAAVNVVANGGVYVSPRLVTATVDANGREHPVAAPASRRVIPSTVAHEVTSMLEQVVATGTGTAAKIASYAVAGKTGTANMLAANGSGYVGGAFVSSFAGFAPAQDPAVTVMVVIDDTGEYGAEASAPTFAQVTTDALLDLGVPSAGPQPAPSVSAIPTVDGRPETAMLGQ